MHSYTDLVRDIFAHGERKPNRTGIDTLALVGYMFQHDMSAGFPLLTTKRVPFKLVASELEFFIKGLTSKKWLQERGNHIWDEWCNPVKVPYGHDSETKARMAAEDDLGPIYGAQWRNFGRSDETRGIDQLQNIVNTLKAKPDDRRMIVSAWNPADMPWMALPPCHYSFQVLVTGGKLHLLWNQRSVDVALGLPFNIASYALLLELLSLESGIPAGTLTGFLADTHIYMNHEQGLREQLLRKPRDLPTLSTPKFKSIFDWEYTDSTVQDYDPHPLIKFDIAI